ncbi:hypothetical protein [Corallococcus carmarthensis]|uniref:Uncharacterized protein n=1 Tax=Corallococcus carmarthensis TaxID=2316728 RepID=A0A3A8JWB3_9BACT|nr:hypothetical protein [Corallococcus carmarthensis]RKG99216.1 hypothetical protein D7X32_27200 [Corallococcus carmarthensis]
MLANAGGAELHLAARAYTAYCGTTGGRSAVTGAQLPAFEACPPLVRAAWLASVRAVSEFLTPPTSTPTREPQPGV